MPSYEALQVDMSPSEMEVIREIGFPAVDNTSGPGLRSRVLVEGLG